MYGNPIPPWNQPSDLEADHKRTLRLARAILLPPRSPKGEPVSFNSQSLNAEAVAGLGLEVHRDACRKSKDR